jgi:ABC-type transporter Mla MlaB component
MTVDPTEVKTICLTGPVTVYEVAAVRELLRTALAEGKPVRIDLSDSGPWDFAGVQLLVSCVRSGAHAAGKVSLAGVPTGCEDIATRSALAGWLASVRE